MASSHREGQRCQQQERSIHHGTGCSWLCWDAGCSQPPVHPPVHKSSAWHRSLPWSPHPSTIPGAHWEHPLGAAAATGGCGGHRCWHVWARRVCVKPLCETSSSSTLSLSPHLPPHPTLLLGDGDIHTPQRADRGSSAPTLASSSLPVFYYQLHLAWRGFSPHIPLAHKRLKNQQNHCLCLKGGDQGEKNSMF